MSEKSAAKVHFLAVGGYFFSRGHKEREEKRKFLFLRSFNRVLINVS